MRHILFFPNFPPIFFSWRKQHYEDDHHHRERLRTPPLKMPEETRRRTGVVLSCTSFAFENGASSSLLVKTFPTTRKKKNANTTTNGSASAMPREYLFNCPESLSRLCMETYSRPRRGLSAVFGFDDLNASLGGLCSLVLRLSVDGHEKCAIIGEERVEKVVDRCDILFFSQKS